MHLPACILLATWSFVALTVAAPNPEVVCVCDYVFHFNVCLFVLMAQNTVISPGYPLPTDTSGKNIHAHGGGILKVGTLYHWYGTSIKTQPGWLSEGITLYTSTDLGTWTDHGVVFHNTSIVDVWQPGPYRIERPKVVFCAHTQKYVMYFHLDTSSFSMGAVGVAQSANPKGPFEWVHGFQPDGQRSLDMGLYALRLACALRRQSVRGHLQAHPRFSQHDGHRVARTQDGRAVHLQVGRSLLLAWQSPDGLVAQRGHSRLVPKPLGGLLDLVGQSIRFFDHL